MPALHGASWLFRSAGMDRQTLGDWVIRYNEHGVDGLADLPRNGRPPKLDGKEKAELVRIVLAGPDPEASGLLGGILCLSSFAFTVRVAETAFRPSRARIWCAFARSGSPRVCT
jgi:hypothetical protein